MKRLLALASSVTFMLLAAANGFAQPADSQTINQWVQPGEDGILRGRLVMPAMDTVVPGASIVLSTAEGQTMQAKTDKQGRFVVEGVQPGVYALTAKGAEAFACCAIHVIGKDTLTTTEYPVSAEIPAANVDAAFVKSAVVRYLPATFTTQVPPIDAANLDQLAPRVVGDGLFRVVQTDGGMSGTINLAGAMGEQLMGAADTNVFIVQDGTEVARTVTRNDGSFTIASLAPGKYSVLAIGPGGMGSAGFTLVDSLSLQQVSKQTSDEKLVMQEQGSTFVMQIAPPSVVYGVEVISDVVVSEQVVGETILDDGGFIPLDGSGTPLAGGGFNVGGGGFAGGGGGGGGFAGGGLGGLAGLAGIGGVIAATASDDDDQIIPPPTASPSTP